MAKITFKPLPPDDPIFNRGIIFVFKNALPEDEDDEVEFISPKAPGRYTLAAGPEPEKAED
jgi:hypothetical protein